MNQTVLFIVGSLIVAIVAFTVVLPYAVPRHPEVPETYPVEIEASQSIVCTSYDTVSNRNYEYKIPSSYTLYFSMFAKSYTSDMVYIDKVVPYMQPDKALQLSFKLSPGMTLMKKYQAPWGPVSQLSALVFPGDKITIKDLNIQVEPGTIYSSTAPLQYTSQVPDSFKCPFNGNNKYELEISGEKVTATIKNPGCAGVILKHLDYSNKYLILTDYKVGDYYYEDKDIPFFLLVYNSQTQKIGFYRKAHDVGVIYKTHTSEKNTNNNNYQAVAFWYDGSYGKLYLDNSHTPTLTTGYSSVKTGDIVVGVAREKPANTAPDIMICAFYWNGGHHCITFNPETLQYKIIKGNRVIKQGTVPELSYDDEISNVLRNNGIALYYNPNPGSSHQAELLYHGNKIKVYMPEMDGAQIDMIVLWEDLVGYYRPGDSRIDGNGDEWIHVTYFSNGTWRVAGYIARGGFKHVFYINNHQIFTKPYNQGWSKQVNGVYVEYPASFFPQYYYYPFETAPLSSYVKYVGVFRDKTITVSGLMSGDRVILTVGDTTKTYTANGDQITIDLLSEFTPRELVNALESGGIHLTIVPSMQHLLYFIPTTAKVHIKTSKHDMWMDVYMPVKTECESSIFVHSYDGTRYTTILTTDDYKMWKIQFHGADMGTYPKVLITVMRGTVRLYSTYGVYTYTAPQQSSTVKINTAPVNYVGVQIGSELETIPYVYRIEIEGTMYYVSFSYGK